MDPRFISVPTGEADAVFKRIGQDWMLIGTSDGTEQNVMTASWGCLGVLWGRPVAVCFIRPQRHSFALAERSERLSLSFFEGETHREALRLCGRLSGRDTDKFAAAGLTPLTDGDVPYPAEASLVLICRRLYASTLEEQAFLDPSLLSHYAAGDYHKMYICEIEKVLRRHSDEKE